MEFKNILDFIRCLFPDQEHVPLHKPVFIGNEKKYLLDTIDSTFISSIGEYVNRFEEMMCEITGASYAVATVNGTNALHISLIMAGVTEHDETLTQSLTFVATCNAISYIGSKPILIDVDTDSLGMSASALSEFLHNNAEKHSDGFTYNKKTGRRIKACVPMHSFGLPCRIDEKAFICNQYNITLVEDAAESIGSYYKGKHTGTFGALASFSFNGNKTITCGGGGAIITDDELLAKKAKHLTNQAKLPHPWAFFHDEVGYNYRMPNINAAVACAQLERLVDFVTDKRQLANEYSNFFKNSPYTYINELPDAKSNYWLNTILLSDIDERNAFLKYANENGVMSRPAWELMHRLPMFSEFERGRLDNSEWLSERLVNLPSSVRLI